jgi:hypothetical protein
MQVEYLTQFLLIMSQQFKISLKAGHDLFGLYNKEKKATWGRWLTYFAQLAFNKYLLNVSYINLFILLALVPS